MTRHLRTIIPAAALLFALSFTAPAQVQSNVQIKQNFELNPLLGAPTVTITSAERDQPQTGVIVKWSVVKPTLTQLIDFDLAVHAIFQNGKSADGNKQNVAGNLREIVVSVPGSTFPLASLKTTLIAKFHTQTVLTDTQTFNIPATGGTNPRPSGNPIDITAATKLAQCDAGKDCFEVKWSVNTNRPSIVGFNAFGVKLDVGYSNGQTVSGNADAAAAQRQVVIKLTKPSQGTPATANVTLNAATTIAGLVTATK